MDIIFNPANEFCDQSNQDGFQRLWTPHRIAYIKGDGKPKDPNSPDFNPNRDCPFCNMDKSCSDYTNSSDKTVSLVVSKGKFVYAVANLYPYNTGHLLICPYRHISHYIDLNSDELDEFSKMTQQAIKTIKLVYKCDGFNIGMNQGKIAGAGISAHLHQHIIPRWNGDANFFPLIGKTRQISEFLLDTCNKIRSNWVGQ